MPGVPSCFDGWTPHERESWFRDRSWVRAAINRDLAAAVRERGAANILGLSPSTLRSRMQKVVIGRTSA